MIIKTSHAKYIFSPKILEYSSILGGDTLKRLSKLNLLDIFCSHETYKKNILPHGVALYI